MDFAKLLCIEIPRFMFSWNELWLSSYSAEDRLAPQWESFDFPAVTIMFTLHKVCSKILGNCCTFSTTNYLGTKFTFFVKWVATRKSAGMIWNSSLGSGAALMWTMCIFPLIPISLGFHCQYCLFKRPVFPEDTILGMSSWHSWNSLKGMRQCIWRLGIFFQMLLEVVQHINHLR